MRCMIHSYKKKIRMRALITLILMHSNLQLGRSEKTYIFKLVKAVGVEPTSKNASGRLSPSAAA